MPEFNDILRRVAGDPGALRTRTTVVGAPVFLPDARETYVLETVKTDDGFYVFLEIVDSGGTAHRVVLPPKAAGALYRHRDTLVKKSKKRAGQTAYATQVAKGVDPAERLRRVSKAAEAGYEANDVV